MRQIRAYRSRPVTHVVPIGSPEALVERPGERRVIFSNRVIIIRQRQQATHADTDRGQ